MDGVRSTVPVGTLSAMNPNARFQIGNRSARLVTITRSTDVSGMTCFT